MAMCTILLSKSKITPQYLNTPLLAWNTLMEESEKMENFALKARTAVKRIAAVTATSVMMGATMFGAVAAADLSDYPAPFVKDGKWVGLIVVGANAAPADVIGATDIAATLAQQATTAAGGGTTTVAGGQSKDIVLGDPIGLSGSGGFDQEMDHGDVSSLKDDTITFQSASYDYREMLVWHNNTGGIVNPGPQVVTSLTSVGGVEDDYKDGIYLEAEKGTIGYYYVFDSTINVSTPTLAADPLAINFLGRKIKITSIDTSGTKFTARVGQEVFLNVGDTVTIEGKKITLKNVGSAATNTPVIVDVDGTVETVTGTETVNGIEISVSDTFYSDNLNERSGTLIVGKDAVETYNDNDKFIVQCGTAYKRAECKKENPDWVWDVDDLYGVNAAGNTRTDSLEPSAGTTIGVINDFTVNDFSDNPPAAGGKYDLPLGGYEVRYDSLTVSDTDYMTMTVSYQSTEDLSASIAGLTAVPAILIESSEAEAISAYDGSNYKTTNKVWIYTNTSLASGTALNTRNQTLVFYRNPTDGKVTLARNVTNNGAISDYPIIGRVNYGETKSGNVYFALRGDMTAANALNLTLRVSDDQGYIATAPTSSESSGGGRITSNGKDDINIWLGHAAAGAFNHLGATLNSEEGLEVAYNGSFAYLGTKDENHRTRYGIVIVDPKSNGASDRVKLKIPKDQVKAKVTVAGPETTVTTSGGAVAVQSVAGVPIAKLDSEVTDKTAYNLILVGGPCANDLAREVTGTTAATCTTGFTAGKATIKLFENAFSGTKSALLVAGYNAADTRNAATVLKDYKSYADKLKGKEVEVASSAGVITVSAPTVAATTTA